MEWRKFSLNNMEINYLLLGVAVFLLACSLHGYRKGFLRIAVSLVSLVVIIVVVTYIAPYVSNYLIEKTPVYENVRNKMVEAFAESGINIDTTDNQITDENAEIESYGLPEVITGALIENNTEETYNSLAVDVFEDYISGYLSRMVIKSGSFLILVAILWAAIYALLFTADILGKIPVLRTFNKLVGLGAGLAVGVIIVWLFFLVIITFFGQELSSLMLSYINKSQTLKFLFNSNQLFKYIK